MGIAVLLFVIVTETCPRWWCAREGIRWYDGDAKLVAGLSREVAATVRRGVTASEFTSNSELFRHEWQFGTYQMAALGLLQVCSEHPELQPELMPAAEQAIDRLVSDEVRHFDAQKWGQDPLDSLDADRGHAAYLGYLNLVLALHRRAVAESRFADLNDRITSALLRRFRRSPARTLETYPGEAYPVDMAAGVASILLYRTPSPAQRECIAAMLDCYRSRWRDPESGLLYQAVNVSDGKPRDTARASGTALAAYFLSFGAPDVSEQLARAVRSDAGSVLGFGYVNEYPPGVAEGAGDIDSGPLIFGISLSATGFSLANSRIQRDRDFFVEISRSLHIIGTPVWRNERRGFVTGGPLGNAILLAMLTAQPARR